jgi:beta-glucosidase
MALRGFKRVHLEPGASTTVSFDLGADQLSILNAQMQRTVELGAVDIMIGASSADTSTTRLTIAE